MAKQLIPVLADALRLYYTGEELRELFEIFDSEIEWDNVGNGPAYLSNSKRLILEMEHSNSRKILEALLPSLFGRCGEMIAKTSWERRDVHLAMQARLEELRPLLGNLMSPTDIALPDNRPFTAKSEIRDLVAKADGDLLLVDAYVGISTLDCLRDMAHPVRILTGKQPQSIEQGFDAAVKDFRSEGHVLNVRRHTKLHDRYLIFNDRCWLIGSSIKDAGKKALNVIECVDCKRVIVVDAEKKWTEAIAYL